MALKTTKPNLGDGSTEYAHCPNCSKMFLWIDKDGKDQGLPVNCTRCGCPLEDTKQSRQWMEEFATKEHQPALAAMGRRSRGEAVEDPEKVPA